MVDCIIAQQIFTSPSPPHLERNILPHPLDTELSHVTCLGQKNMMCGSGSSQLQGTECFPFHLLSNCPWPWEHQASGSPLAGHRMSGHVRQLRMTKAGSPAWASWPQTPGRERNQCSLLYALSFWKLKILFVIGAWNFMFSMIRPGWLAYPLPHFFFFFGENIKNLFSSFVCVLEGGYQLCVSVLKNPPFHFIFKLNYVSIILCMYMMCGLGKACVP